MESSGALATGVLELTQTLTKYNQELQQRADEKARLSKDHAECKKRLSWQQQRAHGLRRNVERLFNETNWLNTKTAEVVQDAQLLSHEIRQCKAELDQARAALRPPPGRDDGRPA